jgi:hypothetical protein
MHKSISDQIFYQGVLIGNLRHKIEHSRSPEYSVQLHAMLAHALAGAGGIMQGEIMNLSLAIAHLLKQSRGDTSLATAATTIGITPEKLRGWEDGEIDPIDYGDALAFIARELRNLQSDLRTIKADRDRLIESQRSAYHSLIAASEAVKQGLSPAERAQ